MKFLWYNIILSFILNWFIAPFSYLFRKRCQIKKGFFWWFLSDHNMYGDKTWRTKLKNKFLRAYLWMLRNPLQNYYWRDFVDGKESNFAGTAKVKFGNDAKSWRTAICSDTKDWHGKIIDFESPLLGIQDITFIRTDNKGKVQQCHRKSRCVPYRFFWFFIIMNKWRNGHEHGLIQHSIAKPVFLYKPNKEGFIMWKNLPWKTVQL